MSVTKNTSGATPGMEVNPQNESEDEELLPIDRGFTYRVTFASLLVGLVIAGTLGALLFALARPTTIDASGQVTWSASSLLFPVSFLVALGILFWSVFNLPVRIARRRRVVLDPEVWPWTGAVIVGVLAVLGFVVAMVVGWI